MSGRLNVWLVVLVVLCGVSFWFGKDFVLSAGEPAENGASVPAPPDQYEMAEDEEAVHLLVLNGTEMDGLARDVSLLLGRTGCVAERVGNAPHRGYAESFLVNRRLTDRRAGDLASRLGGVKVLRERDDRGSEDAVLVLGEDWPQLTAVLEKSGKSGHR